MEPEQIKLINILESLFKKPDDTLPGKFFYTTSEVFQKLQSIYPSETYAPEDVYEVLQYLKFEIFNGSGPKMFWYMEAIQ